MGVAKTSQSLTIPHFGGELKAGLARKRAAV